MDLRPLLETYADVPGTRERRPLYTALLAATVFVRAPLAAGYALTRPDTGQRAVPAFLSADEARSFWLQVAPGHAIEVEAVPFVDMAAQSRKVGGAVLDPGGAGLLLDRAEVTQLASAEVPGDLSVWLSDLGRLGRRPAEVMERLKRAHVHVITGRGPNQESRLYLLEKSDDGTLAVACFSSPETLAQFAEVRRLFEGHHDYAVALVDGEYCLRAAAGLGAYILIDPESPWETQLEPTLM